jgi:4-diphosphocytidyl-2-C-methyl-D-erythritol kinase
VTARASGAPVHVRAPGKLNLFFEVGGLQPDGYHDVASAYQAVSLYEDVVAHPAEEFSIEVSGRIDLSGVPRDDRNLALRAARLLAAETGVDAGVRLEVRKSVPVAGGMGGGSADAAAALVACDALWGCGLSNARLHELAAHLGADVPFALLGGTAVGHGRGDRLSPALARGRFDWVLATHADGLSTPEVFRALDADRAGLDIAPYAGPDAAAPEVDPDVLHALRSGSPGELAASIRNDLQAVALRLRPELADTIAEGERLGALAGIVSGSGPTVAFLAEDAEAAIGLEAALDAAGHDVVRVHGPVPGARVVTDHASRDHPSRGERP